MQNHDVLIIFQKKQKKTCSSCRTFNQCEEFSPAAGSSLSISVVFSKTQQCTRCVYPLFPTLYTLFSSFTLLYHFILGIFLLLLLLLVSLLSFALVTRQPYCHIAPLSQGTKKAFFYHAKPHPHGFHCEA